MFRIFSRLDYDGHAAIAAKHYLFEERLERRHGVLSIRLTQVLIGRGHFGRFQHRIRRDETSGCHHCVYLPEDTVEPTVEVCPAWVEHRRVLRKVIGGGDLSGEGYITIVFPKTMFVYLVPVCINKSLINVKGYDKIFILIKMCFLIYQNQSTNLTRGVSDSASPRALVII